MLSGGTKSTLRRSTDFLNPFLWSNRLYEPLLASNTLHGDKDGLDEPPKAYHTLCSDQSGLSEPLAFQR